MCINKNIEPKNDYLYFELNNFNKYQFKSLHFGGCHRPISQPKAFYDEISNIQSKGFTTSFLGHKNMLDLNYLKYLKKSIF